MGRLGDWVQRDIDGEQHPWWMSLGMFLVVFFGLAIFWTTVAFILTEGWTK